MDGDFLLTITIKNNRLLRAMREEGFETAAALSRACRVSQQEIGQLLAMKRPPLHGRDGTWRETVMRVANTLRRLPEDLFPEVVREQALATNKVEREISAEQVAAITHDHASNNPERLMILDEATKRLSGALTKLTPRQRRAVELRFGLDGKGERPYYAIGEELGISTERARQIEQRALRHLRHQKKFALNEGLVDDIADGTG